MTQPIETDSEASSLTASGSLGRRSRWIFGLLSRSTRDDTETDRSRERFRRAALTALAAALGKAISMVSILVSVPLTLHHLGPERYGLWMTISSFLVLLSFTDLGLGIGLMNSIAHADGKDDLESVRYYVSSAFFMLAGIAGFVLLALAVAYPFIPWARLLGVTSPEAVAEVGPTVFVFILCMLIGLPLSVVQRVQLGYQEGGVSNIWTCLGSLCGLVGLLAAVRFKAGLPWIVLATTGLPLVATLINGLVYFGIQHPDLLPRWRLVQYDRSRGLISLGVKFFVLQICYILSYGMDNIIITRTLGIESVALYSVCVKYYGLGLAVIYLANSSLWTAYGEACGRGDWVWMRTAFRRSVLGSLLISGVFTIVLIAVSRPALRLWVGQAFVPSLSLLFGVGLWGVLDTVRVTSSTFLSSINVIRFQVIMFLVFTFGGTIAKVVGARLFGLEGMAWGGTLSLLVFIVIPMLCGINQRVRQMSGQ